jgi:hypothetical protein
MIRFNVQYQNISYPPNLYNPHLPHSYTPQDSAYTEMYT